MELTVQNKYMNMDPSPNYQAGYGKLYGLISSCIINSVIIIFFSDLVSFHWQGQESQVLKKTKFKALKYHIVPIGTMLLGSMLCVY